MAERFAGAGRKGWRAWLPVVVAAFAAAAAWLFIAGGPAGAAEGASLVEAEQMTRPSGSKVFYDGAASGGKGLVLYSNGAVSGSFDGPFDGLTVRARGNQCKGAPRMVVKVDGVAVATKMVDSRGWTSYQIPAKAGGGAHYVKIAFDNDYRTALCDRNLRLDSVSFATPAPTPEGSSYLFGLIGNDGTHLAEERAAGIGAKLFSLSWRAYYPAEGVKDPAYVERKKNELKQLKDAGFEVILSLGHHDTPSWVHQNYSNTRYVNQFGDEWTGDTFSNGKPLDNGDANLVFNEELRGLVSSYMKDVFADFGTDSFYAVRLGGGRYDELTYPPATFDGKSNLYWAYDENAGAENPVPGWEAGDPSPNGEAGKFLGWYLDSLAEYQNWQVSTLRSAGYKDRAMMLYPSWGMRPGQAGKAVAGNLDGATSAERNGEVQRGFDFARQVKKITDPKVVVTTTWLDAPQEYASVTNPTPVEYLSSLAKAHPLNLEVYGENTGRGDKAEMEFSASQMRKHGLLGMAWYKESEMFSGQYATLNDYKNAISAYNSSRS